MKNIEYQVDSKSPIEKQIHDVRVVRKWNYPTPQEQLDMIWHAMNDKIILGTDSAWHTLINEIKSRYPTKD